MNLASIVDLVGRRIGLDPESLGSSVFATATSEHMRALGVVDGAAYAACLAQNPERLQELVERVVVRETWFFRGSELFGILPSLLAARPASRRLRALSLPCSSGEEPYSLAMALLDAGLPIERWSIDAIDVSATALDTARRGVYREFSFRQTAEPIRQKYFRRVGDDWELDAAVRRLVTFSVGNILDAPPVGSEPYDLVLCRNLLIYFTADARLQAFANLEHRLAPDGLLALGHAEPQIALNQGLKRVGSEACFLFSRQPIPSTVRAPLPIPQPLRRRASMAMPLRPAEPARSAPIAVSTPTRHEASLQSARRLADANRLDEALAECRAQLAEAGPSADAYSLLGVVQQARGDLDEAGEAFRKALYLDPAHAEALTHAMLLATGRGDAVRAGALRERLGRTGPGGEA